jgi:hypothetical protein
MTLLAAALSIALAAGLHSTRHPEQSSPAPAEAPWPQTAPASDGAAPSAPEPATQPGGRASSTKPRVILQVDRHTEISGFLESEDDNIIVVRSRLGDVESYLKSRLFRLVRLIDDPARRPGAVLLRNGQVRRGLIIEDSFDRVLVEIEGVVTPLDRVIVDHVELELTWNERYERLKKELDPSNVEGRMAMCRWLYEERQYEIAREELIALVRDAELAEARKLLTVVEAQLALKPREPASQPADDPSEDAAGAGPDTPFPLLTREDVNLLRVYEIDFKNPPDVKVEHATIEKMIGRYASSDLVPTKKEGRNDLFRKPSVEIVRLLFKLKARELYKEIRVLSEPKSLNLFRQRVHNAWLIPNCATSRCHGGQHAGRLFLHTRQYKDERVWMTNLLILERLKLGEHPLVNYEDPEMSLIIQHALPRNYARLPHPEVKGWAPVFSKSSKGLYEDSILWIDSMYKPRPEYPIEFTPPQLDAPDAPAPDLDGEER